MVSLAKEENEQMILKKTVKSTENAQKSQKGQDHLQAVRHRVQIRQHPQDLLLMKISLQKYKIIDCPETRNMKDKLNKFAKYNYKSNNQSVTLIGMSYENKENAHL